MTAKKKTKTVAVEKPVDIYKLDSIPGLGPVSKEKLAAKGITNFLSLWATMNNPIQIETVTGMKKQTAVKALAFVRKHLHAAGLITAMEQGAGAFYKEIRQRRKLKTGCSNIDNCLRGGFESSIVHEIYGHEGAGKTQLLDTLLINASKPIEEGGLYDKEKDGEKIPHAVYIDTENTFRPDRLHEMLDSRGMLTPIPKELQKKKLEGVIMTPDEIAEYNKAFEKQLEEVDAWGDSRVIRGSCQNTDSLAAYLDNINNMISTGFPIKLVIIDSLTNVFRGKFIGRATMWARSDDMNAIMKTITGMAETHKLVFVVTTQVYSKPNAQPWEDNVTAYGGHIIGHTVQARIKLDIPSGNPTAKKNKFKIIKAAHLPKDEALYTLTRKGLENFVAKGDADDD